MHCGVRRGEAEFSKINFKTTLTNMVPDEPSYRYAVSQLENTCEKGTSYLIIEPHFSVSPPPLFCSQAVVCDSTPRMYLLSGYFLVFHNFVCDDKI